MRAACVRRCKRHADHSAHIARGQPALLVVVVAVQLPTLLLRQKDQFNTAINSSPLATRNECFVQTSARYGKICLVSYERENSKSRRYQRVVCLGRVA